MDSNVISKLWKPAPEPRVLQWIDAQAIERFIYLGLRLPNCVLASRQCPEGKRRATLYDRLERDMLPLFEGANLPFDLEAWRPLADIMTRAIMSARGVLNIAATAAWHGLTKDTSVRLSARPQHPGPL